MIASRCETGQRFVLLAGIALLAGWPLSPRADVPPEQKAEVAHLLSYVRYADCALIRNGTVYDGREGYQHVLDKYDYFRNRIQSTEDFIDLTASKSLLTGKVYLVRCPNHEPRPTAVWLREELARYRSCEKGDMQSCKHGEQGQQTRR